MQLDRLEIAGFLHFAAPAVLDLRDVAPGLVAIVGMNGEGKTRLLDAGLGSLYGPGAQTNAFPSREGTLAEYATVRDAYIDTLWTVEGRGVYHARTNVDSLRRTSDAVLEQLTAGRVIALNDGKVTTFRDAVAAVFPSRRQVLASAYAAQGKQGGFASLDQKGRMELFSEMLGLRQLEQMSATARTCALVLQNRREVLLARIETLEAGASEALGSQLEVACARLRDEAAQLTEAIRGARIEIDMAEASRQALVESAAACDRHDVACVELRARIASNERAVEDIEQHSVRAREDAEHDNVLTQKRNDARLAQIDASEANAREVHAQLLQDRQDRIANNEALLADATLVRAAALRVKELTSMISAARRQLEEVLMSVRGCRDDRTGLDRKLASIDRAATQLEEARRKAAAIAQAPFGENCAPCAFMKDAALARDSILELEAVVALREDTRCALDSTEEVIATGDTAAAAFRSAIGQLDEELAAQTQAARREADLDHAEERIAQYRKDVEMSAQQLTEQLSKIDMARVVAAEECNTAVSATEQRLASRIAEWTLATSTAQEAIQADRLAVKQEQAAADVLREAKSKLVVLDAQLVLRRRVLAEHEIALARIDTRLQETLTQREAFYKTRVEVAQERARLTRLDDDWLDWRLLTQALGRDGVPRLEIDAAGPAISQTVNDLLSVGYGTRFTVDLVTQVPKADGKGFREEFAILVYDNAHGGEARDLGDLSGGERVIVEEALRAGILLFNNAREQQPIRTCWRDETTGALYPDIIPQYVQMLRRMHALGGFRHTLFVTHSEAAAEMADTIVRVEAGVPTIERAA